MHKSFCPLFLILFITCSNLYIQAQAPLDGSRFTLHTNLLEGEKLTIYMESPSKDIWIDINDNKQCDEGEKYTFIQYKSQQFNIGSTKKITVYGAPTYIDLTNNQITSLDLTECRSIQRLIAGNNELKSLDLSTLSELRRLSLYENKLEDLDLTNNPLLYMAYLSDNKLVKVILPRSPQLLNRIYLYNNRLSQENIKNLFKSLPQRQVSDLARIYIIDSQSNIEENNCPISLVSLATVKNWSLYDWRKGDNDGLNPYGGSNVSNCIPEDLNLISIYPNPASEKLHIKGAKPNIRVVLRNFSGEIVSTNYTDVRGQLDLDLTMFLAGHYILQVGAYRHTVIVQ